MGLRPYKIHTGQFKSKVMLEKIKNKIEEVEDRNAVYIAIGQELKILPVSVKNNYFTRLGYIPKNRQKTVLKHILRQLKKEHNLLKEAR